MKISVEWYTSDCRVIYWGFDTHWTWDEYFVSFDKLCRLARSVDFRVDVMAEVQYASMLPMGALGAYQATAKGLPENVRSLAIVGANIWMRAMISGLRQFDTRLGSKIFFADTRYQARQLLCEPSRQTQVIVQNERRRYAASSELLR
jgi:hypothetical protein